MNNKKKCLELLLMLQNTANQKAPMQKEEKFSRNSKTE
jgi:hypothetical protein